MDSRKCTLAGSALFAAIVALALCAAPALACGEHGAAAGAAQPPTVAPASEPTPPTQLVTDSVATQVVASPAPAPPVPEVAPTAAAGMVVYVDPETGQVNEHPSAAQEATIRAALHALVNESSEGLFEEPLPGGGFKVDLRGRFQHAAMVAAAPSGARHELCSDQPSTAERVLTSSAPSAAPEEK